MLSFELFYFNLVDEFMVLAKNYGEFFSSTSEFGEHQEIYVFGMALEVCFNKNNPAQKTYRLRSARGRDLGCISSENELAGRAMLGEMIANEFARMKSIHYGTIRGED